jgi:DNA topoisomerase-6 subunit A
MGNPDRFRVVVIAIRRTHERFKSRAMVTGRVASRRIGAAMRSPTTQKQRLDRLTVKAITNVAQEIQQCVDRMRKPEVSFPVRSLSNVRYDPRKGYFEIGKDRSSRTLTVNTAKTFAQTLKMMALSKELVETSDFATKRDGYYQSKNWGEAMFDEQSESDTVMDDIEAMFSIHGISREQLRYIPDEHGGAVAGELIVYDTDLETGKTEKIDCTRFGSGAYSIPSLVEQLTFETKAKFVLCIETGGMFQRLQSHKFWKKAHCILVSMAGVPTRATRRFVRRLSDQCRLPVYAFVDCDPYGISNIYRTLKVGPEDIEAYELPTHPLKDVDVKRAKDALKNDPFFKRHKPWQKALTKLLKMGVRAEQQALARWGLNYVIDEYLPRKLKDTKKFLP